MEQIQNRFDRLDYLRETSTLGADPDLLLEEIVNAMSDREFHGIYNFICRMHEIEPDIDKFNGYLELGGYDRAIQGKRIDNA